MGFRKEADSWKGTDSYRPGQRRNSYGRDSSRSADGRSQSRHRRRSNSQQHSTSRGPATSHAWNYSGRNFTAPGWSSRQHDASRYGDQRAEAHSSGALGEVTNQSPLPSPVTTPGRSRPRDEDEDSLFVGDGPRPGYIENYGEPEPNPLPRPPLTTRQAENQSEQSEFPEAFHRRPETIAASKKAHGFYHPAMTKPTLKPLPAKANAAQTGENILKPRYISTTNIPIEPLTTQPPKTASKKPVSPKTAVSMQVAALVKKAALSRAAPPPKAAAPLKAVPPPTSGTGLPPKPPVPIDRFPEEDSNRSAPRVPGTSVVKPESSPPFPHTFSIRVTTAGNDKPANKEPQQSIETPTLPLTTDLRPSEQPKPENKPDPKLDQASTRSIQKRKRRDTFSAAELKTIWALCFEHRQAHDVSRLGHFALPIPSHSLHLVSPTQLDRAKRYVIPDIISFEVTPLQLDGDASPIDPVRAELFALDLAQQTTPTYHKLQLRPSTNQTDGLAWPVLRSMQVAWELTARWYKEVIVDGGWAELGRLDREDTVIPDAMDIDGEEENSKNDKITGMGLGDFVAGELKKTVTKTKHRRDEPKGSADIDDEISSWLSHLWRDRN